MSDDNAKRVLRDLLAFLEHTETCARCTGPSIAYDECHAKKWAELKRRMRCQARDRESEQKPN